MEIEVKLPECVDCGDEYAEECPKSTKDCKHHCNCSWVFDECCWCLKTWGEE